ncbi:MAG: disulfide bond formation protein DsbA [Oceanospirillaceae bacterium]|nr:disulfide bond formation protein DsbA [Oceanospirillaceae bacterium]|tara:strand:- start:2186 stop:2770 length:585 start_codon:yes stop_codon:yes gene_type:complete
MNTVDFYYDFISPAAYLAFTQLPELCKRHDAQLNYKPMLLGGVFKATGITPPATIPSKLAWVQRDFARYAERYGVAFQQNPHFIFNTVNAMRGAIWAADTNCLEAYNQAMFQAAWADAKDLGDKEVLADIMNSAGLDSAAMLDTIAQPECKGALIEATEQAVINGVFGAPTMIVNGELYFGQDRLEWVERALAE